MKTLFKKITAAVTAFAVTVGACALFKAPGMLLSAAASGTCGDNLTWTLDNNGKMTIRGSGSMTNYDYAEAPWYDIRDSIKSLVIEDGVTSIGKYAFLSCKELVSVFIPGSVKNFCISPYTKFNFNDNLDAFYDCPSLSELTICEGVESIGRMAFYNCAFTSVTIPKSVTCMHNLAFSTCPSLKEIIFTSETPPTIDPTGVPFMHYDNALEKIIVPCTSVSAYKSAEFVTYSYYEDKVKAAHNLEHIPAKPETCTADGNIEYWHCLDCKKYFKNSTATTTIKLADTVIKSSGHKWDSGTVTTEAGCTTTGTKTFTCTRCKNTKTETISATDHNWNTAWNKDSAYHWHICSNSGCTEKGDKAEHIWESNEITKQPTCTDTGTEKFTCNVCGQTKTETVSATDHSWNTIWSKDGAYHWYTCKNSGCTATNGKADHVWDSGKVTKAATCTADGVKTFTCSTCKQTKTETIKATGHNLTYTAAQAATCTAGGNVEYWHCSNCGKNFDSQAATKALTTVAVSRLGHDFSEDWEKDTEHHWHNCTRCDETDGKDVHNWGGGEIITEATEEHDGEEKFTCPDCDEIKTVVIPQLPHTHDLEHYNAIAPDCTTDGNVEYWRCTKCGNDYDNANPAEDAEPLATVIVPAIKHNWGEWTITKAPTRTEVGTAERICQNDNSHIDTDENIPVLTDSIWEKTGQTNPGVNEKGEEVFVSEEYGEVKAEIPELSDDTVWEKERTEPTLDEKGEDKYTSDIFGEVDVEIPELSDETVWEKERTEPTLDEKGEDKYTSDIFGEVDVEIPELSDETVWEKERTEPTLDEKGEDKYTSDIFGEVDVEIPELSDETVWEKERTEPTLDEKGEDKYTSDIFGEVKVEIPELSDSEVWTKDDTQHVEATEDSPGKDVYISEYGEVAVIIPPLEHTHVWGGWTITKAPTETETGTAERFCTKDNSHKETVELPVLSDTSVWTKDNEQHVDPTENSPGKDVYVSEYGTVIVEIPPTDHVHTLVHVDEVPPTETTEGVKEHWHCEGCGKDFFDENGENEVSDDELKIGKLKKEVQTGENAPVSDLVTSNEELVGAVLTPDEQKIINEGTDIKIILTVEDASDIAPEEDKAAVETAIGDMEDYKLGQYLDVNLLKIIGDQQEKITETNSPITIMFEIPAEHRGGERYSVIRVHGGETTVLEDHDDDKNTVTIKTDRFSTYALAYSEKAAVTPGGDETDIDDPEPDESEPGESEPSESEPDESEPDESEPSESEPDESEPDESEPSESEPIESEPGESKPNESKPSENRPNQSGNSYFYVVDNTPNSETELSDYEISPIDESAVDTTNGAPSESGEISIGNSEKADEIGGLCSVENSDDIGNSNNIGDSGDSGNPSTGTAVSLIPWTGAVAVLAVTAKRKKK